MTEEPPQQATNDGELPGYRPTSEERTWALVVHMGTLISGFLLPLVVLLTKGSESKWVRAHAQESLNFQLTLLVVILASIPLSLIIIGYCTMLVAAGASVILVIIAGLKAYGGEAYRYPFAIRFIRD